ncbi:MAG: hypothetical protein AB7L76_18100 [Burkholderiaceae bacterium]
MIATLDPLNPQFMYDARRKVGTGRATDKDGGAWIIEFHGRDAEDRMTIRVAAPDGKLTELLVSEDDFAFSDNTVQIAGVPGLRGFMHPVYLKKMRGFTRGNVPTPDLAGSTLP